VAFSDDTQISGHRMNSRATETNFPPTYVTK